MFQTTNLPAPEAQITNERNRDIVQPNQVMESFLNTSTNGQPETSLINYLKNSEFTPVYDYAGSALDRLAANPHDPDEQRILLASLYVTLVYRDPADIDTLSRQLSERRFYTDRRRILLDILAIGRKLSTEQEFQQWYMGFVCQTVDRLYEGIVGKVYADRTRDDPNVKAAFVAGVVHDLYAKRKRRMGCLVPPLSWI